MLLRMYTGSCGSEKRRLLPLLARLLFVCRQGGLQEMPNLFAKNQVLIIISRSAPVCKNFSWQHGNAEMLSPLSSLYQAIDDLIPSRTSSSFQPIPLRPSYQNKAKVLRDDRDTTSTSTSIFIFVFNQSQGHYQSNSTRSVVLFTASLLTILSRHLHHPSAPSSPLPSRNMAAIFWHFMSLSLGGNVGL